MIKDRAFSSSPSSFSIRAMRVAARSERVDSICPKTESRTPGSKSPDAATVPHMGQKFQALSIVLPHAWQIETLSIKNPLVHPSIKYTTIPAPVPR
jgi:hypothetical protein